MLSPWLRSLTTFLRKAVLITLILNIKIKLVWCNSSVVVEIKEDFCDHSHREYIFVWYAKLENIPNVPY